MSKRFKIILFIVLLILIASQIAIPFKVPNYKYSEYIKDSFGLVPKVLLYQRLPYKFLSPKVGDIVMKKDYDYMKNKFIIEIGIVNKTQFIDGKPFYDVDSFDNEFGWLSSSSPVSSSFILGKVYYPFSKRLNQEKTVDNVLGIILAVKSLKDIPKTGEPFYDFLWWITESNQNIISRKAQTLAFLIPVSDNDLKNQVRLTTQKDVVKTRDMFANYLKQQGFLKNIRNSSKTLTDDQFYDYIEAYQKDNLTCLIEINADTQSYFSNPQDYSKTSHNLAVPLYLKCISKEEIDKSTKEQSKFLHDLGIKNSVITGISQIGDSARLDIHGRRAGHYAIVKLAGGKWIEVHSGQDTAECAPLDKYNIPKEIVSVCYDSVKNDNIER